MKHYFSLLFFISCSLTASAQNNELTFLAAELQDVALRYTGDTLTWPIIVSLAERDIQNNSFTLSPADLQQLETLSNVTARVLEQRNRMKTLIGDGASVFAKDQLIEAALVISNYNEAVKQGNINEAISYGNSVKEKVDLVEETLLENRMVEVQALLEAKKGDVDKRLGILGSWNEAIVGDLFKEADGLRTGRESYANLGFTDGSKIIVDPNTTAIIRKARIDRLSESADTEITLEEGGLLAKLSAVASERSNYILNAGSSQSELRTTNFYAESDGDETVKLTNYDGIANVSANDVSVTIRENEGTIVKEGEPPSPPIQLLPSPEMIWASNDTIVYTEQIIFPFQFVDGADSYIVQRSTSSNFDANIEAIKVSTNTALLSYLPLGNTYVRVQSVDALGLRGPYSESTRIVRNIDNQPPPAFIDNLNGNILFTLTPTVTITGATQPDAKVLINNERVDVDASGRFTKTIEELSADQMVSILATDNSGNNTVRGVRVVYLTEDILFNFALSGARGMNPIRINQPTVTLSSRAYPGLEVIINNGGTTRRVQTDSQGRWGITMNMQQGELSITFKDVRTGEIYRTKSFTVEAN
ncbi:MAG: FecR domain-containing protein [Balneolaceae bacterium]|nr:FecR domain-containing protein [Balneolaceae bacterium]